MSNHVKGYIANAVLLNASTGPKAVESEAVIAEAEEIFDTVILEGGTPNQANLQVLYLIKDRMGMEATITAKKKLNWKH